MIPFDDSLKLRIIAKRHLKKGCERVGSTPDSEHPFLCHLIMWDANFKNSILNNCSPNRVRFQFREKCGELVSEYSNSDPIHPNIAISQVILLMVFVGIATADGALRTGLRLNEEIAFTVTVIISSTAVTLWVLIMIVATAIATSWMFGVVIAPAV